MNWISGKWFNELDQASIFIYPICFIQAKSQWKFRYEFLDVSKFDVVAK